MFYLALFALPSNTFFYFSFTVNFLSCLCSLRSILFFYFLLNPVPLGFCHCHCIETTLDKVTNDLHIAKSQDHFLILFSLLRIPSSLGFQEIMLLKKIFLYHLSSFLSLLKFGVSIFGSLLYLHSFP